MLANTRSSRNFHSVLVGTHNVADVLEGRLVFYKSKGTLTTCIPAKLLHSYPTLCNSMDCSPPGSSVHVFLQARTLKWVAITFFRGSSQPRDRTYVFSVSHIISGFFNTEPLGKQYDPATTLLGIYSKELKTYVHIKPCTWISFRSFTLNFHNLEAIRCI